MIRGKEVLFLILYLIFGLYFINSPFSFVEIPRVIFDFNSWIIFLGGILLIFGGINYFRVIRSY